MLHEANGDEFEELVAEIAKSIALVEYYYGTHITGDYPIMKRFNQMENIKYAFDIDGMRFGLKSDG